MNANWSASLCLACASVAVLLPNSLRASAPTEAWYCKEFEAKNEAFVVVGGIDNKKLQLALEDFARLYIEHRAEFDGLSVDWECEIHTSLTFPAMREYSIFQFLINYLTYPIDIEVDSEDHWVVGFFPDPQVPHSADSEVGKATFVEPTFEGISTVTTCSRSLENCSRTDLRYGLAKLIPHPKLHRGAGKYLSSVGFVEERPAPKE